MVAAVVVSAHAIGSVRVGTRKAPAVAALTRLFGAPSSRFVNGGCRPRYTEVAWGHLYVEFRAGRLNGFRSIELGWPPRRYGVTRHASDAPPVATARGIVLGSTLRELRAAYGRLELVGADRYEAGGGLVFLVEGGRVVEVKSGTCGDF